MNGTSGFQKVRSSKPDHQQIGCCTSNGIDSEQVPGSCSVLTISSLSPQALAQCEKRFLTPFILSLAFPLILSATTSSSALALQAGAVEIGDLADAIIEEPFCLSTTANPIKFVGLEVTQSIQSMGMTAPSPTHKENNTVPLIAYKKTIARAYFDYVPPGLSTCAIDGTLVATRNGAQVETPEPSMNRAYLHYLQNGDLFAKRTTLLRSLNFELPQNWVTTGILSLTVQLKDRNGQSILCAGCTTSIMISFQEPKPLRVRLVKFIEEDANGNPLPGPTQTDTGLIRSWLKRAFPIPNIPSLTPASWDIPMREVSLSVGNTITNYENLFVPLSVYRADAIADPDPIERMDNRTRLVGLFANRDRGSGGGSYDTVPAGTSNYTIPAVVPTGPSIPDSWSSYSDPPWDNDGSYADWYTGHELAHTLGFRHLRPCNTPAASSDPPFDNDPFISGSISDSNGTYFGFDVGHVGQPIPGANMSELMMKPLAGTIWHDLRTYCTHRWMSPDVYIGVRDALVIEDRPPVFGEFRREKTLLITVRKGDYLAIVATVNLTKKKGEFNWTARVSRAEVQPDVTSSDALIRLVGENDEILVEKAVLVQRNTPPDTKQDEKGMIRDALTLPPNKAFKALRLFIAGETGPVAELSIRKNPPPIPSVKVNPVGSGALAEGIRLSWETDADYDKSILTYSVRISFDHGMTWQTLAAGLRRSAMVVTAEWLTELRPKGATEAVIRVIANDGFNTSQRDEEVVLDKLTN